MPGCPCPRKQALSPGRVLVGQPHAAGFNTSTFNVTSGASFRMVLDVGNRDNSRTINTPGRSGNPYSPHYRDLAPLWATGLHQCRLLRLIDVLERQWQAEHEASGFTACDPYVARLLDLVDLLGSAYRLAKA